MYELKNTITCMNIPRPNQTKALPASTITITMTTDKCQNTHKTNAKRVEIFMTCLYRYEVSIHIDGHLYVHVYKWVPTHKHTVKLSTSSIK